MHNFNFTPRVKQPVWCRSLCPAEASKVTQLVERRQCNMSATRMLSPRNVRLLSRGRDELLAVGPGGGPRVRSLTSPPLSSSSPGRALSSLSATRRGLPKEKMSENGVSSRAKVLTIDTMNPTVKKVEYAVRGPIVQRAVELERELSEVCTTGCLISVFTPPASSMDHTLHLSLKATLLICACEMHFVLSCYILILLVRLCAFFFALHVLYQRKFSTPPNRPFYFYCI